MKNKIKEIMGAVFEMDAADIKDSDNSTTIQNWDSLNHMNLIVALEEEFNVRFEDEEIIEITSLEAIENSIKSKAD
jgi:acyl carrier protein